MMYGLIGEKLPHSFSKEIHESIADYEYNLIEIKKDELDVFMKSRNFSAINVTIPYKQDVIPYLDYISTRAEKIGAVNTIVNKGGKLYGYNTDYYGLRSLIEKNNADFTGKKVLILGTGGTSKTAYCVADDLGASVIKKVSPFDEPGALSYEQVYSDYTNADYIINASPCGMYPNNGECPIMLDKFSSLSGVFDVIYNPLRSSLVMQARQAGITAEGGLYMLIAQAVRASEIFTDMVFPKGTLEKAFHKIFASKQNIVLTGMPGSGKTTKGRLIAEKLGREFIDTDARIAEKEGREISEIFASDGEAYFRNREAEVIADVSKLGGVVIGTGGGSILRTENTVNLKKNGRIYFIDRDLNDIAPTGNRPLSSNIRDLKKRYNERYSIYKDTADVHIQSRGIDEDAEIILREVFLNENQD